MNITLHRVCLIDLINYHILHDLPSLSFRSPNRIYPSLDDVTGEYKDAVNLQTRWSVNYKKKYVVGSQFQLSSMKLSSYFHGSFLYIVLLFIYFFSMKGRTSYADARQLELQRRRESVLFIILTACRSKILNKRFFLTCQY